MTARSAAVTAGATTATGIVIAALLTGWLAVIAGAGTGLGSAGGCATRTVGAGAPAQLRALFIAAAARFSLGPAGPAVLAGLTKVESDFGRDMGPSSAGAVGWTQFLPATWKRYGVDADGDGRRDPYDAADAIFTAARYLHASGAPGDWHAALLAYNHAGWYVTKVLAAARQLAGGTLPATATATATATACAQTATLAAGLTRIVGGGRLVPIPGQPGQGIDVRLLPDIMYLIGVYRVKVTAAYAPTGHAADGEHPLGLAVDLVPGPGGSWDDVDRLARWAEPVQNHPRQPFRWVGYDGDPGHGRGNHLHLSWQHAPAPTRRPPATWVEVFDVTP